MSAPGDICSSSSKDAVPYCFEYSSQSRWQAVTEMEKCLLGGLPGHLGYTLHIGGYNGSISHSATHLTGGGHEKSYLGVLPRPVGYIITVSLHQYVCNYLANGRIGICNLNDLPLYLRTDDVVQEDMAPS